MRQGRLLALCSAGVAAGLLVAACAGGSATRASVEQPDCVDDAGVAYTCLVLDASPELEGMQATAAVVDGATQRIELWLRNVGGDTPGLGAFTATMPYDGQRLRLTTPAAAGEVEQLLRDLQWECLAPAPTAALPKDHPFGDGDPATSDAYIGCFRSTRSDAPGPTGDMLLATFGVEALAEGPATIGLVGGQASANAIGAPLLADCSTRDEEQNASRCLGISLDVLEGKE